MNCALRPGEPSTGDGNVEVATGSPVPLEHTQKEAEEGERWGRVLLEGSRDWHKKWTSN